jgi:hypothetical protein
METVYIELSDRIFTSWRRKIMTQIETAKTGKITYEMEAVADQEELSPEYI